MAGCEWGLGTAAVGKPLNESDYFKITSCVYFHEDSIWSKHCQLVWSFRCENRQPQQIGSFTASSGQVQTAEVREVFF